MPPDLEALRDALGPVELDPDESEATILFRMSGFDARDWLLELTREGARVRPAEPREGADLTIFLDARQLRGLAAGEFLERQPQGLGNRALLDHLPHTAYSDESKS